MELKNRDKQDPQGGHIRTDLDGEGGFGQKHSRHEGTQCGRHPQGVGSPGGADHDGRGQKNGQIAAARGRRDAQEPWDDVSQHSQGRTHAEQGKAKGPGLRPPHLRKGATVPQGRDKEREGYHGNVLHKQDSQGVPAMHAVHLRPGNQKTQHRGRTAESDDGAQRHRGRPVQSQSPAHHRGQDSGHKNLHAPAAQGNGPHGAEPPPGELETDGEQEKGNAQFGYGGDRLVVGQPVKGVRAEQGSRKQVTDDRTQTQTLKQGAQYEGAQHQDQEVKESSPEFHQSPRSRRAVTLYPVST